jgi:hypothetical protein
MIAYMTNPGSVGAQAVSEVHEFTSFVRSFIAGALEGDGVEESEGERLWREVYGRVELDVRDIDDLVSKVGALVHRKLCVAAAVTFELAQHIAEAEKRSVFEIIDQVEADFARRVDV